MGRRELFRRAKILALANTVHSLESADTGGDDDEFMLMAAAVDWANVELAKLGVSASDVTSVRACLSLPRSGSNDGAQARARSAAQ